MVSTNPIRRRTVLLGAAALAAASQLPAARADAAAYPTFNIKTDFGAVGNGTTNDTKAFQDAAAAIAAARGGTLDIPAGVYVVGRQLKLGDAGYDTSPNKPYYQMQEIISLDAPGVPPVEFLHIRGATGAVLRLAPGLHYGSFYPAGHANAGQPYHHLPVTDPFENVAYGCEAGRMIDVLSGSNITIENLEFDGNNDQLVLGGRYGDTGIQLKATGIRLLKCTNVAITDVYTHHHGLDGVTIGWGGLTTADPLKPHTVTRVRSEYNGRQGLSWTGGNSLTVTDSKFNHTGRGAVRSEPSAGLDIEAESSITRNGYFNGCEFVNNAGEGLNCTHGDSGYTRFEGCTFWGTTNFSALTTKPGLVFKWSNFYGECNMGYGGPDDTLATRYGDCLFEDRAWTNGQVFRNSYLVTDRENTAQNVQFADCTFRAHQVRTVWTNDLTVQKHFLRCTFEHRNTGIADLGLQCHPWGCRFVACTFTEAMGTTSRRWYINLKAVVVAASPDGTPTTVTGPTVRWGNPTTGLTGTIPVGTYG